MNAHMPFTKFIDFIFIKFPLSFSLLKSLHKIPISHEYKIYNKRKERKE